TTSYGNLPANIWMLVKLPTSGRISISGCMRTNGASRWKKSLPIWERRTAVFCERRYLRSWITTKSLSNLVFQGQICESCCTGPQLDLSKHVEKPVLTSEPIELIRGTSRQFRCADQPREIGFFNAITS